MKDRDPYHLALTALTRSVGVGRFGWGRPLVTTVLAAELGLSPTPVREALARLAGEGILEHHPGRGYFAPSPGASDIVELYDLHRRLLLWALTDGCGPAPSMEDDRTAPAPTRVERLFSRVAASCGNGVLLTAHRRAAAQLRPIRAVEDVVAPLPAAAADRMASRYAAGRYDELAQEIGRYHEDRCSHAQAVFVAMRRSAQSIDQI